MTSSRTIVLTGVTRGLGRALLPHFVRAGHTIIGCGRNATHIAALQAEYGANHTFTAVDVADATAVEQWGRAMLVKYPPPDLLINNAAVMNPVRVLWEITAHEFDHVIDVNVKGVANVLRAFVPAMVARQRGIIVNLSSGWGRSTSPEVAPYCASKYAIEGLTHALAAELPKGMAAIPLNPGIIDTDMLRSAWGNSAGSYPSAERWAMRAAPFLLNLSAADNGKSLTVR